MTALAVLLAFLLSAQPSSPAPARVTRAALAGIEKAMDGRFERAVADPFDLLGNTRGVYLDGYGVVFSAELNLIVTPNLNPFHQRFSKQEIARIHERKLQRLPLLKQNMREMLVTSAAALENLPPDEQVVLAVSLFRYSWEDASGIPAQIVMQAQRRLLLSAETRDTAIHIQEF
jgi:hypothetical protein